MASDTEKMQRFMGAVLARRRAGNPRPGDPKPPRKGKKGLSTAKLRDFASSVKN